MQRCAPLLALLPLALVAATILLLPEHTDPQHHALTRHALRLLSKGASHEGDVHLAAIIGGTSATGGSMDQVHKIAELEKQVKQLRESLASLVKKRTGGGTASSSEGYAGGGGSSSSAVAALTTQDTAVPIPLMKFLGLQGFFAGVSWDPYACFPNPRTVWPHITTEEEKAIQDKMVKALAETLARIKNVDVKEINTAKPYHELFEGMDASVYTNDPDFPRWRRGIMVTLSQFLVPAQDRPLLWVECDKNRGRKVIPDDLGSPQLDCRGDLTETEILDRTGYYAMPYESVEAIAHGMVAVGLCTSQPRGHADSYAHWLRQDRMFNASWHTFHVPSPDQDAALLLFDLLYEKLAVFTRQYWLGVITMQNPFDMYSIQDIIFQTRPTLLIETGTANGGSALLWASIMHLAGMNASRVLTMDMNAPKWEKGGHSWGGMAREDPTQHRLWKQHVTFLQGSTTDPQTVQKVQDAAAGQRVMVLLDSHHSEKHVLEEMERYCPLVAMDCYCVVEDTKMSRWASDGPLLAVKRFLAGPHGHKFKMDRDRELLYTHHAMGYLKRIA